MNGGYVRIPRDIYSKPAVSMDADSIAVFMYLVMNAAWADFETYFNGKRVVLKPGQLATGRKKIAAETGVNENKIYRVLKRYENEHLIEQLVTAHGSLISLLFWDSVADCEQPVEQQTNNKRTTSEQPVNTIKRRKEEKKINIYSEDPAVNKAIEEFIANRKATRKPMTARAIELFIKRLNTLSTDPGTQIKLIEQSIERGWQTVYPLKDDARKGNSFTKIIEHDWDMGELERVLLNQ